jgi:carboxyl-terminal processing protease
VQSIRPVAYDGHLKVTTAHYYLPSGRCIQAIDYAERQKGRELKRDTAGGILPDIVIPDSQKTDISYTLFRQFLYFDYATHYRNTHDSIAGIKEFAPSDNDIDDFLLYLKDKQFTYETETSHYYKELIKMAQEEDIDAETMQLMDSVLQRLKPDFREAVLKHKEEVKRLLGAEISSRYHFQQGKIAYMLRDDEYLKRAIEEIRKL